MADVVDIVEHFVAAIARDRGGENYVGKFVPRCGERLFESGKVFHHLTLIFLIGFCKDDGERDAIFAKELDKGEVDFLGRDARIDQNEDVGQLFAFEHIVGGHFLPKGAVVAGSARIAIAREIDEIPLLVDEEMVDELGFAGASACFSEVLHTRQHIDE